MSLQEAEKRSEHLNYERNRARVLVGQCEEVARDAPLLELGEEEKG
jgi:hypothetical protein